MAAQDLSRAEILTVLERMVSKFIAKKVRLTEATSIYQDGLWLGGDDAYEFLEAVQAEFGTDMYYLDWETYFPIETDVFPEHLGRLIGKVFRFKPKGHKPFLVGHLIDVIRKGSWFEPSAS